MIKLIAISLYAAFAIGGALLQAEEHAHIIRAGGMSPAVKRDWSFGRAGMLAALSAGLCIVGMTTLFDAMVLSVGAWCLWSSIFRRALNHEMKWDRDYVGSTSRYDVFMISLVLFAKNWRWSSPFAIRAAHSRAYVMDAGYRDSVRKAGRLANRVETSIACLSLLVALLA